MQFIIRGLGRTNNRLAVIHCPLIIDRSATVPALTGVCVKPAVFVGIRVSVFRKVGTKVTFGRELVECSPHTRQGGGVWQPVETVGILISDAMLF